MTDRERVLLNIAVDTAGTVHDEMVRLKCGWTLRVRFGKPAAQFIPTEMAAQLGMPLKPGDIIRCKTNPTHEWGISEFVEQTGYADFVLREIGSRRLLNMYNESLDVLRFMTPSRLYMGAKLRIYNWASSKAFSERYNPHGDYFKRCGGVEFDGDTLTIWCRPHIWAAQKKGGDGGMLYAQPKKFTMQWSKQTKLKDIVNAMLAQGFSDDFEFHQEKPANGQGGYATITRDDLLAVLSGAANNSTGRADEEADDSATA